ncbi:MAG: 1-deoxy-D-xylulose-5-phosphate reductoisomerase [Acidimicrobiia bacterium]|nr:MAG: 1-deoxy-D-xylulose-5-phosphate reductoisomerase [Acidimicrobiia bacterium]
MAAELGLEIAGIAARSGSDRLYEIAQGHPRARVVVAAPTPSERLRFEALGSRVGFGSEAVAGLASTPGVIVVNGIVGAAGLAATIAALEAGNRLALANKESLVAGGPLVEEARRSGGGELIPVDSEHSALYQLLDGRHRESVNRLILPASGGPFFGMKGEDLATVTPEQALRHPTWQMGPRITIDSATLMNKALEVIEAHHLFGFGYDDIDVVVHPQSVVHGLVQLVDGSLIAHLGEPDMAIPIRYALSHPQTPVSPRPSLSLLGLALQFEPPDIEAFPCLRLGYEAGSVGGTAPAVLNAADEIAVHAFLTGRIGFGSIPVVVERTLNSVTHHQVDSVADVMAADAAARSVATDLLGDSC